ncbi:hypothetical protein ASPBRDRAFT_51445 [Aspergillus brasiliensis CBS 101740]|uniref:Uncharacterized protein n=1 Tax=Aspergillus brasiliensis (strain CBS 101740 / IMI 381727 / IBT 21946) TaxID=767769 RepID=A0A1L9UVW6_ASPBC|nr:hypothetical protein ASPBRDRAFT_51445 [Aspergillus brasiliensis CBS 101740]
MWLLGTPWFVQIEDCVLKPAICARRAAAGANSEELKPSLVEVPLSWDPQMQVIDGKIRVIRIIVTPDMTCRVSNQSVQAKVKISRWQHRSPAPRGVMGVEGGGGDTNKSSLAIYRWDARDRRD